MFLDNAECPKGECEDFADFLVCLSTSVGATITRAQRSNPLTYVGFVTRFLSLPHESGSQQYEFHYHQFGLLGAGVWDGCVKFPSTGVPMDWDRDSTYQSRLVAEYSFPLTEHWSPTPTSGFTPSVSANPP
jgi:hypothetical protein